jgi:ATP-binding cassette, subfamily C, bacterial exporter for protease/lipase
LQSPDKRTVIRQALDVVLPQVYRVILFSLFTNILVLAPSWYMMEVYDRVVNSRNHTTLLMLTLCVVFAYLLLEVLEWVRRQIMHETGDDFDRRLRDGVFHAMFAARLQQMPMAGAHMLRDLRTIREFLPSPAMLAVVDVPYALLVLVIMFWMHPMLGWFALAGALVQFGIGFVNERRIRQPLLAANRGASMAQGYAEAMFRNAQVIGSMGMMPSIRSRWGVRQQEFLGHQAVASDHAGTNAAFSKLVQSLLGSLVLGVGCWLSIKGELHGSGMIVASILGGKVLSPFVQLIGSWRQVAGVIEAWQRLDSLLERFPESPSGMPLPAPKGQLIVENVVTVAPGTQMHILKGVKFALKPGSSMAVLGPSASGKTTLARVLVGIWPAMQGNVRLDGSDIYLRDKAELGRHVGYLPQNVELFNGTIADNIARFGATDPEKLDAAIRLAGLASFVSGLPDGVDTVIGEDGAFLSGGERQRIGLARAAYGMPNYVVLDEPDSNLDEEGEIALLAMIAAFRENGSTVILITHKVPLLQSMEFLLVLVDGMVQRFGMLQEVLDSFRAAATAPPSTSPKST